MIKIIKIISLLLICSFIKEIYCVDNKIHFECIPNSCLSDHSCVEDVKTGLNKCVDYSTRQVVFQSSIVNIWYNNNDKDPKMQVSVDIINENINIIQNLIIVIDSIVKVNDLWGMDKNKSVYQHISKSIQIPLITLVIFVMVSNYQKSYLVQFIF
ncbi:hypothetical protein ACTFIU_004651 [Dictyostelium citrinum]